MWISEVEVIGLKQRSDQFSISFQKFVQHLTVVDVVATLRCHRRRCVMEQLILLNRLDSHLLIKCLVRCRIEIVGHIWNPFVHVLCILLVEVLLCSTLPIISSRNEERYIKFDVSESVKYFEELFTPMLFVQHLFWSLENPFLIAHGWGTWPTRIVSIDTDPLSFILGLDHLKSVESWHVLVAGLSRDLVWARLPRLGYLLMSIHTNELNRRINFELTISIR